MNTKKPFFWCITLFSSSDTYKSARALEYFLTRLSNRIWPWAIWD